MAFEKLTAINFQERKPALHKMQGISEKTMTEHYKLYQGYVNKYNEIMERLEALSADDFKAANPTYSLVRVLKVELTRALGGVKNHEIYFANLGGKGGKPSGDLLKQIEKDFGSYERWEQDFKATGIAARGWAWLAWDHDLKRFFNAIGDEQNTFPFWNATPVLAMDMFEHAYFYDFQTNRAGYIDTFFKNIDWDDVAKRFAAVRK